MLRLSALAVLLAAAPAAAGQLVEPLPIKECSRVKVRLDEALALRQPLVLSPDDAGFVLLDEFQGRACHMELEGNGDSLESDPQAGWVAVGERISAALVREGFQADASLDRFEASSPDAEAFARERGRDLCSVGIGYVTPPPDEPPSAHDRSYLIHVDCFRRTK